MKDTSNPTKADPSKEIAAQNAHAATASGNDAAAAAAGSPIASQPASSIAGDAANTSDQEKETNDFVSAFLPSDTTPERLMLDSLKGYRRAAEVRFKHLLTGMANSTAEALRCLADAEIHLADHIEQQETAKS